MHVREWQWVGGDVQRDYAYEDSIPFWRRATWVTLKNVKGNSTVLGASKPLLWTDQLKTAMKLFRENSIKFLTCCLRIFICSLFLCRSSAAIFARKIIKVDLKIVLWSTVKKKKKNRVWPHAADVYLYVSLLPWLLVPWPFSPFFSSF